MHYCLHSNLIQLHAFTSAVSPFLSCPVVPVLAEGVHTQLLAVGSELHCYARSNACITITTNWWDAEGKDLRFHLSIFIHTYHNPRTHASSQLSYRHFSQPPSLSVDRAAERITVPVYPSPETGQLAEKIISYHFVRLDSSPLPYPTFAYVPMG